MRCAVILHILRCRAGNFSSRTVELSLSRQRSIGQAIPSVTPQAAWRSTLRILKTLSPERHEIVMSALDDNTSEE
ncbi:MAG: hypothetical protein DRH32_08235 [Deltaproteobacteria bacterium]|nr:MAG: hypothetical protein DRH32_08235 [Deltaproteobacteria bacterium]